MEGEKELLIRMVLDGWHKAITQADELLDELPDERLLHEIAPGKNRGIYLLGHLTATHDQLFRLLGLCQPIFPEYENLFLDHPDKAFPVIPSPEEVRKSWRNVNIQLGKGFGKMQPAQWLERHTAVSEEDFQSEPHRNKLNIVLTRTGHLRYHLGQLMLLKA